AHAVIRRHRYAGASMRQREAGVVRLSVEEHGACATIAPAADELRTGEMESFANRREQALVVRDVDLVCRPIHSQLDCRHDVCLRLHGCTFRTTSLSTP